MQFYLDFTDKAREDIASRKRAGNKIALRKLFTLFEEWTDHPFTGTGKPEPLKHMLSGMWSRRINKEHRIVYEVKENILIILSVKGHY